MEQLELVLKDSASLAPFDLDQAEQVQVWVPVPQAWFEPNLLNVERESEEFDKRIKEFQIRRAEWLARRAWLRERARVIARSVNGQPLSFPDPDPGQLEQPEEVEIPNLEPPEQEYQTELGGDNPVVLPMKKLLETLLSQTPIDNDAVAVPDWPKGREIRGTLSSDAVVNFDSVTKIMTVKGVLSNKDKLTLLDFELTDKEAKARIDAAINDLYERSKDNTDLNILKTKGLLEFISFLESKVAQADDVVEFGFLQSRTNMYRIRQQVLGQADASRLATSSTLADIATRESAYATQKDRAGGCDGRNTRLACRATAGSRGGGRSGGGGGVTMGGGEGRVRRRDEQS
jgi:hypothetical protein